MTLNNRFLNDLFQHLPFKIAWINRDRVYARVSPSYAGMFDGKKPKDLIGRSIYELFPNTNNALDSLFDQTASTGGDSETVLELNSDEHQGHWFIKVWPVQDSDKKPLGWILSILDLTPEIEMQTHLEETLAELEEEREKLQADIREKEKVMSLLDQSHFDLAAKHLELEQVSEHRSQLLTDLSHELRTPLNIILGYAQLLQDEKFGRMNTAQRDVSQRIVENCRVLSKAIDKRVDRPRRSERPAPSFITEVALPALLSGVLSSIRPLLREKQIRVKWSTRKELPTIVSDPVRLRRIFLNLINNLAKFVRGVTFTLALKDLPNEKCVAVHLTESGSRKIPESLSPIFNDFFRLEKQEHTGAGVSIVKELLDQIGGHIELKQKRTGVTFVIRLPYFLPGQEQLPRKNEAA
ncbi:MAG: PAS domain-containing protein [Nitrospirae bacterium]|nr:PAS domain-containing protein [Candidatus Manganitrophaceae bacterium]